MGIWVKPSCPCNYLHYRDNYLDQDIIFAKVWEGGSPIWDGILYLCLALETDESALSPQIEESIVCVSTVDVITLHQA